MYNHLYRKWCISIWRLPPFAYGFVSPVSAFFNELWEKLRNGASLMYTWNIGLGSDFVSVFAYYLASPLNWLVVLFPKSHIIEFIELLIIFKISLSGATFFYFLKEHFVL